MASGDTITYTNWNTMSGAICHNPSESARWKHFNTSDDIYFEDDGNQFFKFEYDAGTKSILYGADSYREDIHIMANSLSPYSRMILEGSGNIYLDTYGDIYFRLKDNRIFTFTSAGSNKIMYGGTSATMNLMLAANSNSQLNGNIFIEGQENITVTSYADILFKEQNTQMFKFEWDGSDKSYIKGGTDANHDVVIQANTNAAANGYLGVYGQGDITLAAYQNINFYEQASPMFEFKLVGGESIINTDTANTNLILDSEADIFFREQGTQMFKFAKSLSLSKIYGSNVSGNLQIIASENNTYPMIRLYGSGTSYGIAGFDIPANTDSNFRVWLEGSTKLDFSPYYSYFRIMPSSNQPPNVGGVIWFSGSLSSSDLYYKSGTGGEWKSLTEAAEGGASNLSDLSIDIDKDWDGHGITNIPYISSDSDLILGSNNDIYFTDKGTQSFKFVYGTNQSYLYGGSTNENDLIIQANSVDSYPMIWMIGDGDATVPGNIYISASGNSKVVFGNQGHNSARVYTDNNYSDVHLDGAATNGARFNWKAHEDYSYPYIDMVGSSNINIDSYADIYFKEQGTQMFRFNYTAGNSYIRGPDPTGGDLYIYANDTDKRAGLFLYGSGNVEMGCADGSVIQFLNNTTQMFKFNKQGGNNYIEGGSAGNLNIQGTDDKLWPLITLYDSSHIDINASGNVYIKSKDTQIAKFYLSGSDNSVIEGRSNSTGDLYIHANSTDMIPWLRMFGGGSVEINYGTGNDFRIDENGVQAFKFYSGSSIGSILEGGAGTGEKLRINANSTDTWPRIHMVGNSYINLQGVAGNPDIYMSDGSNVMFLFDRVGTYSYIYGTNKSASGMRIKPNYGVDNGPKGKCQLELLGSGNAVLTIPSSQQFRIYDNHDTLFRMSSNMVYIKPGGSEPSKIAGNLWMSGSTTNCDIYLCSANSGDWISLTASGAGSGGGGSLDHIREDTEIDGWDSDEFTNSGIMWNGSAWVAMPSGGSGGGVSTLSALSIDDHKDWNSKGIHNASYISGVNIRGSYLKTTEKVEHVGDSDTYLALKSDQANLVAGGVSGIAIQADGDTVIGTTENIYFKSGSTQMFKFTIDDPISKFYGNTNASADLWIYARDGANYPRIEMNIGDASYLKIQDATSFKIFNEAAQIAKFYLNGADSFIQGGADTSDDLEIKANSDDDYPYITLNGSGSIVASYGPNDGGFFRIRNKTDTQFTFSGTSTIAKLYGPDEAGNDLRIYANTATDFPHIRLKGDEEIELRTKNDIKFYEEDTQSFKFQYNAGANQSVIMGDSSTGSELWLYGDTLDSYPYINIIGSGSVSINTGGYGNIYLSGNTKISGSIINSMATSSQISGMQVLTNLYSSKPTATNHKGEIIRVSGGTDEKTWIFMSVKNDANSWEWIQLGLST